MLVKYNKITSVQKVMVCVLVNISSAQPCTQIMYCCKRAKFICPNMNMQLTNPLNWFLGSSWSSCGRFLSRAVKLKRRRLTKFLTGPAPPPSTSARNFLEALKGKIIWFTRDLQITKGPTLSRSRRSAWFSPTLSK